MADTISVIYTPVGPISGDNATGTVIYHMTLVYTTAAGNNYYISAGPANPDLSLHNSKQETANQIINASSQALTNQPSVWGTIKINGSGSFNPGDRIKGVDVVPTINPNTGLANPDAGTPYQKITVSANATAAQWNSIVQTYNAVASLNLTYSPLTSNSNSLGCTALTKANLPIPTTPLMLKTPACSVKLPTTSGELQAYLNSIQGSSNPYYGMSSSLGSDGSVTNNIDYLASNYLDFQSNTLTGTVRAISVKNSGENSVAVYENITITGSGTEIKLVDGNLSVDVVGSNDSIQGTSTGYDINGVGNNNTAAVNYSSIDFSGTNNWVYGSGNTGSGWDFDEDGFYGMPNQEVNSQTSTDYGGVVDSKKLVEAMASFNSSESAGVSRKQPVSHEWAVISAPS